LEHAQLIQVVQVIQISFIKNFFDSVQ
jgi:hypothetical protein